MNKFCCIFYFNDTRHIDEFSFFTRAGSSAFGTEACCSSCQSTNDGKTGFHTSEFVTDRNQRTLRTCDAT